jgi:hypothetical protein
MTRADVNKVDVEAIDVRHKLRQRVQLRFTLAPVISGTPVAYEILNRLELYALRLIADGFTIGPPRRGHALAQIDERLIRKSDIDLLD